MLIRVQTEGYRFRFFDRFDDEARQFEDRLRSEPAVVASIPWPRLAFWQGYRHLQTTSDRFFVLQMTRADSDRSYQVAVVERASMFPFFKSGLVPYWIPRLEPESLPEQAELLSCLKGLCLKHTSVMSLRVHAYVPGAAALDVAERLLRENGFENCDRHSPARTRILDLRPPIEDILAQFPKKTRTLLQTKRPDEVRVKELARREQIPELQSALDDSFHRSVAKSFHYDFESLFGTLEKFPGAAAAFGLCLSDDWNSLKAFIAGVASPPLFEYTAAGSRTNARLRQLPFNYILLWRLVETAKALGASTFDMGGITDGGPGDPLAGISFFKRRFSGLDVDIGREFALRIRPGRCRLYSLLRAVNRAIRTERPSLLRRRFSADVSPPLPSGETRS